MRPVPGITTIRLTELIMTPLLVEVNLLWVRFGNKPLSTLLLEKNRVTKGSNNNTYTRTMQIQTNQTQRFRNEHRIAVIQAAGVGSFRAGPSSSR